MSDIQKEFYLGGDFMTTARPWTLDQLWNRQTSRGVKRLKRESLHCRFNTVSLHVGPKGTAKTSTARIRGMIASCERLETTPQEQWRELPSIPCGKCAGCVAVQWLDRNSSYLEFDGVEVSIESLQRAVRGWGGETKYFGCKQLPRVIAVDEADGLSESAQLYLHKLIEDSYYVQFILIMRTEETRLTLPMADRVAASTYHFGTPSREECVEGLKTVAAIAGMTLEHAAAVQLVEVFQGQPRGCLSGLNQTRPYGPVISVDVVRELFVEPIQHKGDTDADGFIIH